MLEREAEAEKLREEMSSLRRQHAHAINEKSRALDEMSLRESEARTQMETLVRQQAAVEMEMKSSADKISALKEEVERLRRRVQVLQQESADKEVKLMQLTKQHQRDKEDLEGMNTALDSKQMELELVCYLLSFLTVILIQCSSRSSGILASEVQEALLPPPLLVSPINVVTP